LPQRGSAIVAQGNALGTDGKEGNLMFILVALLLLDQPDPPKGFTIKRESVKIEKVFWYDVDGKKWVTNDAFLQIRMTLTNIADHPIRWPGFSQARLVYGTRYVGGAKVAISAPQKGARWENSLATGQELKPGEQQSILLVFPDPKMRGKVSLTVQWKGETPGWVYTVGEGFLLPEDQ
jgi:hypothetical protein